MLNKDTTRIHSQTWLRRWGPLPAPDCYALAEQITQSISFFCTAYRHWSVVLPHPQLQGEMAREKKNAVTKIINQKLELGQTSLSDSVPLSHPLRELSPCKIQLHTFFFFFFLLLYFELIYQNIFILIWICTEASWEPRAVTTGLQTLCQPCSKTHCCNLDFKINISSTRTPLPIGLHLIETKLQFSLCFL